MRYTVLTSRTFHNRITRYLGVLVAAALIATLGLPSAVQAQTPRRRRCGEGTVRSTGFEPPLRALNVMATGVKSQQLDRDGQSPIGTGWVVNQHS